LESFLQRLEFYNRDKGRKALNLTEKYKIRELAMKKTSPAEREQENVVSGYWR
jgi:hypothetical protein